MARGNTVLMSILALCLGMALPALAEDPWADSVAAVTAVNSNPGFNTPEKTLGEPCGGGVSTPDNSSLHSIGTCGSFIVLKFNTPVTDDPRNPFGMDCIVYGNAMYLGGNPQRKFQEPGLIEISADTNGNGLPDDPWYVIPGSRGIAQSQAAAGIPNPTPVLVSPTSVVNPNSTDANLSNDLVEYDWGYADCSPSQRKCRDNYVRPDDPHVVGLTARSGGGDAFDMAWAVNASGQPAGLTQFTFLRVWTLVQNGGVGGVTTEMDAAADVAPNVDDDGDGILDEYETRVAGTDPLRPESTVLALEIPPEDGGSASGAELGAAADAAGNRLRLISNGTRVSATKKYNCIVDITHPADPGGTIPGLQKSGAVVLFSSSEPDFEAAEIQDAELSIVYSSGNIAGLDETQLQPYRYAAGAWTQDGISAVVSDLGTNTVQFRSRYAGTFVLASVAGAGDTGAATAPIALTATPVDGIAADGAATAAFTAGPLQYADDTPVPNGTLVTVATTLGGILQSDADAGQEGLQLAVAGGMLSFTLAAGTQAGAAHITAVSTDGQLSGQIDYPLLPGAPVAPAALTLLNPSVIAPAPAHFSVGPVLDPHGNRVADDTALTVVVEGGTVYDADAASGMPGLQLATHAGMLDFWVQPEAPAKGDSVFVTVSVYINPTPSNLLCFEVFTFDYQTMPLPVVAPVAGILLALLGARRFRRGVSR